MIRPSRELSPPLARGGTAEVGPEARDCRASDLCPGTVNRMAEHSVVIWSDYI